MPHRSHLLTLVKALPQAPAEELLTQWVAMVVDAAQRDAQANELSIRDLSLALAGVRDRIRGKAVTMPCDSPVPVARRSRGARGEHYKTIDSTVNLAALVRGALARSGSGVIMLSSIGCSSATRRRLIGRAIDLGLLEGVEIQKRHPPGREGARGRVPFCAVAVACQRTEAA